MAIAACFVFRRKISRSAFWDFFDSIGPTRTPRHVCYLAPFGGKSGNRPADRRTQFMSTRPNSQSTAMQFTKRKTIGGRAWLSISMNSEEHERALVLWSNSTLGLLLYWWLANKQQAGRGSIGKTALQNLCVLDVAKLSSEKLKAAEKVFGDFGSESLKPLHQLDSDKTRHALDRAFMTDVLGFSKDLHEPNGPMQLLRMKLAREPSVVGHKKLK
jgi:hypothetical protein